MDDVQDTHIPTHPLLHPVAAGEMETAPPSAFGDGYWPGLEAVSRNLEGLQRTLNERGDLRLFECDKTTEDLETETRTRFESDEIPEPNTPPADWNHVFLRHRWNVPGSGPEPSLEDVVDSLLPIIGPPLVADELQLLYDQGLELCQSACDRLAGELDEEMIRIWRFTRSGECTVSTYDFLRDEEAGPSRIKIVACHLIKRRRERLGSRERRQTVDEGAAHRPDDFSFRVPQRSKSLCGQQEDTAAACLFRSVCNRWGKSRGEYKQIPWLHNSASDRTCPSNIWEWITSRPWFVFELEKFEELIRFHRLPRQIREYFHSAAPEGPCDLTYLAVRVRKLWEARSVLEPEWETPPVHGGSVRDWWWPRGANFGEEESLAILNDTDWLEVIVDLARASEDDSAGMIRVRSHSPEVGAPVFTEDLPLPKQFENHVHFDLPDYDSAEEEEKRQQRLSAKLQIESIALPWNSGPEIETDSCTHEGAHEPESSVSSSDTTAQGSSDVNEGEANDAAKKDVVMEFDNVNPEPIDTDEPVVHVDSQPYPGTLCETEVCSVSGHSGMATTNPANQIVWQDDLPMSDPEVEDFSVLNESTPEGDDLMSEQQAEVSSVSIEPEVTSSNQAIEQEADDSFVGEPTAVNEVTMSDNGSDEGLPAKESDEDNLAEELDEEQIAIWREEGLTRLRALGIPGLPSSDPSTSAADEVREELRASYQGCVRSASDESFLPGPLPSLEGPGEKPVYRPVDWSGPSTSNVIENVAPDDMLIDPVPLPDSGHGFGPLGCLRDRNITDLDDRNAESLVDSELKNEDSNSDNEMEVEARPGPTYAIDSAEVRKDEHLQPNEDSRAPSVEATPAPYQAYVEEVTDEEFEKRVASPVHLDSPDLRMHPRYHKAFQQSMYSRLSLRRWTLLNNLAESPLESVEETTQRKLAEESLKGAWPNEKERHDFRVPPLALDTYENDYNLHEWVESGPSPVAFEIDGGSSSGTSTTAVSEITPQQGPLVEFSMVEESPKSLSGDQESKTSLEAQNAPPSTSGRKRKASALGPLQHDGAKRQRTGKKTAKGVPAALEEPLQLASPPLSDPEISVNDTAGTRDAEDTSNYSVVILDNPEEPAQLKKESPDPVDKAGILKPVSRGVKKSRAKKPTPTPKSLTAALERSVDLEVSATGAVSEMNELPWWSPKDRQAQAKDDERDEDYTPSRKHSKKRARKDVKSAVLGPVEHAGVKKQVSASVEMTARPRRSARGAAINAASKISQAYESGLL